MNLGQLIGELLCREGAAAIEPAPAVVEHKPVDGVPQFVRRDDQVIALIRTLGRGVDCRDVAAALGMKRGNTSQVLHHMAEAGKLKRVGPRRYKGGYRYELA